MLHTRRAWLMVAAAKTVKKLETTIYIFKKWMAKTDQSSQQSSLQHLIDDKLFCSSCYQWQILSGTYCCKTVWCCCDSSQIFCILVLYGQSYLFGYRGASQQDENSSSSVTQSTAAHLNSMCKQIRLLFHALLRYTQDSHCMLCEIKLLFSDFKACNSLGSGSKKDHHAVKWGMKMTIMTAETQQNSTARFKFWILQYYRVCAYISIQIVECYMIMCTLKCVYMHIYMCTHNGACKVEKVKRRE